MITIQTIPGNKAMSNDLFAGSPIRINYLWKSLIIEKRISFGWLRKLYKGSTLDAFGQVLSSPLG